jgi:NAD(P)-dependent dehydrogenase (short-subunit alcohol dehydrogenase family)
MLRNHSLGFPGTLILRRQSKLANVVYAKELARRYPTILTVSVHPGIVDTGLVTNLPAWRRWLIYFLIFFLGTPAMSEERGRMSQLWVAAGGYRNEIQNGAYYEPVGVLGDTDSAEKSEKLARDLWDWTAKVLEKVE